MSTEPSSQHDTCRTIEVDGESIRVRGAGGHVSPEAADAIAAVVRAARDRMEAGEHHADRDPILEAALIAAGDTRLHGHRNEQMQAAIDAITPLIRKRAAAEISAACEERYYSNLALTGGDRDIIPRDGRVGLATGYQRAAKIAREIGGVE